MNAVKIIVSLLLLANMPATAQTKFYFKPSAGVGTGNLSQRSQTINTTTYAKTPATYGGLALGYRVNRFDISAGVTYMRIGYKITNIMFADINNTVDSGSVTYYYNQLLLPVLVGYDMPLNNRFHFIPQTGIALWYTLNGRYELETMKTHRKETIPANAVSNFGNTMGVYSTTHLNISYDVSPKLAVSVAPSLYYMITTFNRSPLSNSSQRLYSITLDLGLTMNLGQ